MTFKRRSRRGENIHNNKPNAGGRCVPLCTENSTQLHRILMNLFEVKCGAVCSSVAA